MTSPSSHPSGDLRRLPGLYRRWELTEVVEQHRQYQIEDAGTHVDGTPLVAVFFSEVEGAAPPENLTGEVFGTQDDRAIWARVEEAIELIDEQPEPAEAVRRIPPATRHAVDTEPIRRAAAWLIEFSNLYEQETRNGNEAS